MPIGKWHRYKEILATSATTWHLGMKNNYFSQKINYNKYATLRKILNSKLIFFVETVNAVSPHLFLISAKVQKTAPINAAIWFLQFAFASDCFVCANFTWNLVRHDCNSTLLLLIHHSYSVITLHQTYICQEIKLIFITSSLFISDPCIHCCSFY